jgi:hypothetical protein
MDVCIYSLLSKRTTAQLLFPIYCFVLGKVLALLGNGQICVLFYVLRISGYNILNSIPYLELQRNIIAPRGFLKKTSHNILFGNAEDHHLTLITLKYLDCIRRCPIRAMAGNSPDGFFFTINAHFSFKILFGVVVKRNIKMSCLSLLFRKFLLESFSFLIRLSYLQQPQVFYDEFGIFPICAVSFLLAISGLV